MMHSVYEKRKNLIWRIFFVASILLIAGMLIFAKIDLEKALSDGYVDDIFGEPTYFELIFWGTFFLVPLLYVLYNISSALVYFLGDPDEKAFGRGCFHGLALSMGVVTAFLSVSDPFGDLVYISCLFIFVLRIIRAFVNLFRR